VASEEIHKRFLSCGFIYNLVHGRLCWPDILSPSGFQPPSHPENHPKDYGHAFPARATDANCYPDTDSLALFDT
jgi:hypothetical protein